MTALRRLILSICTLILLLPGAAAEAAAPAPDFYDISDDGSRAFFSTTERMVAADTDNGIDLYERSGSPATTTLLTPGTNAASADPVQSRPRAGGERGRVAVFFTTTGSLAATDTDSNTDIYRAEGGVLTHISAGAINGNGAFGASFQGASEDGSRVFFTTSEPLVATDTDTAVDVYQQAGNVTTPVSAGAINGNGPTSANFSGASADGTRVFFTTTEPLVTTDTDLNGDVYQRVGNVTTLVSAGAINGNGANTVAFGGASDDGTRVFFHTTEKLVTEDTDGAQDVYERSGGTTTLISAGAINGNQNDYATFSGASEDGSRVFFSTDEQLVAVDTDDADDVYQRSAGATTRVSGPTTAAGGNDEFDSTFSGASADGTTVFITTAGNAFGTTKGHAADDVFARLEDGTIRVVSGGAEAEDAAFAGATEDGARAFFTTKESVSTRIWTT